MKTANTYVVICLKHAHLKSNMICVICDLDDFNNLKEVRLYFVSPFLDDIGIIEQSGHVKNHPGLC